MNIADDVHHFGHIGFGATLIDNRQIHIQHFGHSTGAHHTADIGADHSQVFDALLLDVVNQNRGGINIVYRHIKKALNLVGMQIHSQHAVDTGRIKHIGHQLGRNRHPHRARAAVLAGIAEIRNRGGDAAGRGAFQRIGDGEDFHQIIVGGCASGLQNKHITPAYVFQQLNGHFAV